MPPATGRAAIDATIRSALAHDYPAIKLKYAGGEPLLRFPLALELHRYAQAQTERHGLALDGIILSNGTLLTDEMVAQMQAAGLRLMISLDGLGEMHDCQRHYADGRGSFKEVSRAIDRVLAGGLVPDISITVSGRNAAGLPETVAWVLDRNLPFSLNFYRENAHSAAQRDLQWEEERLIEGMLEAYNVIEHDLPERSLLASLLDRANLAAPHLRTCSAGQGYWSSIRKAASPNARWQWRTRQPHIRTPTHSARYGQAPMGCKISPWTRRASAPNASGVIGAAVAVRSKPIALQGTMTPNPLTAPSIAPSSRRSCAWKVYACSNTLTPKLK